MIEPPLVAVSFKVIKSKSCCYIDGKTGDEIPPAGALLLDMQTANLICEVWKTMTIKANFQRCIDRWGVSRTVEKCWNAVGERT